MEDKTIRVVIKSPGHSPVVREIPNTLKAIQTIVEGYIQVISSEYQDCLIILNEEGKLMGLDPNFMFCGDLLVGTVVFVGDGGDDFISLTDEQVDLIMNDLAVIE